MWADIFFSAFSKIRLIFCPLQLKEPWLGLALCALRPWNHQVLWTLSRTFCQLSVVHTGRLARRHKVHKFRVTVSSSCCSLVSRLPERFMLSLSWCPTHCPVDNGSAFWECSTFPWWGCFQVGLTYSTSQWLDCTAMGTLVMAPSFLGSWSKQALLKVLIHKLCYCSMMRKEACIRTYINVLFTSYGKNSWTGSGLQIIFWVILAYISQFPQAYR